jgi:hypothetical protein
MSTATTQDWQRELSASEREFLREVALALRGIRYGSVVLTVHDGRIVELNKTERIRKSPAQRSQKEATRPAQREGRGI